MSRRHEQTLLQKEPTHGQKHMRKCSTSLVIREIQIKTILRYYFTPVRMAKINMIGNKSVGENMEKGETSCTVGGNANWYRHSVKQCVGSSRS